jgi:hypothetical protein
MTQAWSALTTRRMSSTHCDSGKLGIIRPISEIGKLPRCGSPVQAPASFGVEIAVVLADR